MNSQNFLDLDDSNSKGMPEKNSQDYLAGLNSAQRKAVMTTHGPLLIIAGAGTGKTKTITHRIAHLIHEGVDPNAILAITFTNKAAEEMRDRVYALLPKNDAGRVPFMKTFHALGVYLLRSHTDITGYPKHFAILDSQDQLVRVKEAMMRVGVDPKTQDPARVRGAISREKGNFTTALAYQDSSKSAWHDVVASIWLEYEDILQEEKAYDFDDLLVSSVELLKKYPHIRAHYQQRWTHVHIDEYQDTNKAQYELSRLLTGEQNNICVVGDGDQNIYSWRGADISNIMNFPKDFPGATVITLEENYRSTGTILEVADSVIVKNKNRMDKMLKPTRSIGNAVVIRQCMNENDEGGFVAERCIELIAGGVHPKDIAVLYRTNFQSRVLEESCLLHDVPYSVLGVKFFDRKEVKDVLSYLRAGLDSSSIADIKRIINVPKRGLGKESIAKIFSGDSASLSAKASAAYGSFMMLLTKIHDYAQEHSPLETISYIIQQSGIQKELEEGSADDRVRLENIRELISYASRYDDHEDRSSALTSLLEDSALMSDQDSLGKKENEKNTVRLMTIHASKGLEFRYVFIVGLEQGLFPSTMAGIDSKRDAEEERRLFYVALTRARDQIYLSYVMTRRIYGKTQFQMPSEFLSDIPAHLSSYEQVDGENNYDTPTSFLEW